MATAITALTAATRKATATEAETAPQQQQQQIDYLIIKLKPTLYRIDSLKLVL